MIQKRGWFAAAVIVATFSRVAAAQPKRAPTTETFEEISKRRDALVAESKFAEATVAGREAIEAAKREHGDRSFAAGRAYIALSTTCLSARDHKCALDAIDEAAEIGVRAQGDEAKLLLSRVRDVAREYYKGGAPKAARSIVVKVVTLLMTPSISPKADIALTTDVFSQVSENANDWEFAEKTRRRAIAWAEMTRSPQSPEAAHAHGNLGWHFMNSGRDDEAEASFRRAVAIADAIGTPSHRPEWFVLLGNWHYAIGTLEHRRRDLASAEASYKRAIEIVEKEHGRDHAAIANYLSGLAEAYEGRLDHAAADAAYERAIALKKASLSDAHPELAKARANHAAMVSKRGRYARAEAMFLAALAPLEGTTEHRAELGETLAKYAHHLRARGEGVDALKTFLRASEMLVAALGPVHPTVFDYTSDLGEWFATFGRIDKAREALTTAFMISSKVYGEDSPVTLKLAAGLAYARRWTGDHGGAARLYARALEHRTKTKGPTSPEVGEILSRLSDLKRAQGDVDGARDAARKALLISEVRFGEGHPRVTNDLVELATGELAAGDTAAAIRLLNRALAAQERLISETLATGSEGAKIAFAEQAHAQTNLAVHTHVVAAPTNKDAIALALSTVLRRKGRALDAVAETMANVRATSSPEAHALVKEIATKRSTLAGLLLAGPKSAEKKGEHGDATRALRRDVDALESKLAAQNDALRSRAAPVDIAHVQDALPPATALVEYFAFNPVDTKPAAQINLYTGRRFVAYVVRKDTGPAWVDLGSEKTIDAAIETFRAHAKNPDAGDPTPHAKALYNLIIKPIVPLLGDARRLVVSPDRSLNLVPIAALVDDQNRFVTERFSVSYVGSGRDTLRWVAKANARTNASPPFVVAAPDYGPAPAKAEGSSRGGFASAVFTPLPGTAEEAALVTKVFPDALVARGADATAKRLESIHAPSVLHVATHGFFAPSPKNADATFPEATEALARSGLALAGANLHDTTSDDDGVLSALEAAQLDLWGTKLVVLSACETALGRVTAGEGVYGLRRAFFAAGAETLVTSLWKVDDAATRDLMAAYYAGLKRGEGRSEALRRAQLAIASNPQRRHPYFWAAFIPVGDIRPLDATVRDDLPEAFERSSDGSFARVKPRGCGCAMPGAKQGSSFGAIALAALIMYGVSPRRRRRGTPNIAPRA